MDFEQIEDKTIERIKAQMAYIRTCETYAGQLEGEIESLVINYPAIFISYGGSVIDWIDVINVNEVAELNLLVCAKNLRGQAAARKDAYGCYQMIVDTLAALTNQTFGLAIEKLKPIKIEPVFFSKTIFVYGIKFQTNFDNTYS